MTVLLMKMIPTCFELCVSYDWRVMASNLSPKKHHAFVCQLLGLLFIYFGHGSLYLLGLEDQFNTTEDAVVHLDTFWISAA